MTLTRSRLKPGKGFKPRTTPMKSAAFARVASKEGQAVAKLRATGQREAKTKAMKHGKKPASVEEKRWMASVAAFGCIVCYLQGRGYVPCAVHHIVEGGRRVGHLWTIGLCDPGHHQNTPDRSEISRHPNKARFVAAYGTEYELREKFIAISGKAPVTADAIPKQLPLEQ
jgi:hypothetical protein